VTRAERLTGTILGALFVALHLPFLPPSLEDLDSINFALGVQHFDISQHQPHPPGYPLFIAAAKLLHAVGLSELHALSLLGVFAGGFALFACVLLFRRLGGDGLGSSLSAIGLLMVALCPLFWLTASRPLSDMAGLAASLAIQALLVGLMYDSTSTNLGGQTLPPVIGKPFDRRSGPVVTICVAACLSAFAAGIRSQVVWLTVPLLLLAVARLPRGGRPRAAALAIAAYAVGGLAWFVPLVMLSGGPAAYLRVFYSQGAEDLTGVAMLATTPTLRQLVAALQSAFVAPWSEWAIAAGVLTLAVVGLGRLALRSRSTLLVVVVAFGPYLLFDLFFQETITTRYALPLVVPVAYLAYRGAALLPRSAAAVAMLAVVASCAYVSDRAMYGYATMEAPGFRMLGDMALAAHPEGASAATAPPVLAMHRREFFDLRRPFQWVGNQLPQFAQRLGTPPKHEWLEVVKYWNAGGRAPVWFIADPPRSDLALFRFHHRPTRYRFPFPDKVLLGGSRPSEMDWHVVESPDWYLGEGWAITPETAGTAREDRKGPAYGGIIGWVKRHAEPGTLMIGGRNLTAGAAARLEVTVDGAAVLNESIAPGFFLRMIPLTSTAGAGDYAVVTVTSDNPELAIEQFDAQPRGRVVYGFGDGWNEQEYNPATGLLWRWSSDRSTLRVRAEGHGLALTLGGEIEAASKSHVTIKAGDRLVTEFDVDRRFTRSVLIPKDLVASPETVLSIASSVFYVPAEKKWRSRDRRTLGLKLSECSITPVS
jgi:hypothetical protein